MIKSDLNWQVPQMDYTTFDEFLQSNNKVIKKYLIDLIKPEQVAQLKDLLMSGEYELEDRSQAVRFGLVWDNINKKYFEMDDSDDSDL